MNYFVLIVIILWSHGYIFAEVCQKEGQFQYKSSCYTVNPEIEWLDAIMQCRFINAEFLIIESDDEFKNITESLQKFSSKDSPFKNSFFIGAEDQLRRGFLKWFRTENRVPDNFLCEHFINEYNASINRMKLCAVLDQNLKCIDGKNCTFSLPVICETNCTKATYMKTRLCLDMEKEKEFKSSTTSTTILTTTTKEVTTTHTRATTTTRFQDRSCEKHKCENNAKCIPFTKVADKAYLSSLNKTYLCNCTIGFSGIFCEKDFRPCSNYVCINNSTCEAFSENPMEFTCKCMQNFEGFFCENNVICDNVTCENGGYCTADYFDFKCECTTYFSGRYCEIKAADLTVLENVSTSISAVGLVALVLWVLFLIVMDLSKFLFKIEPKDLSKQRKELKKNKLLKRIKRRINNLINRYKKLELDEEEAERLRKVAIEENAKTEEKNISRQKTKRIKREITHFSVHGIKYIDEDENNEDELDDRNRLIRRFVEKIWTLRGAKSEDEEEEEN